MKKLCEKESDSVRTILTKKHMGIKYIYLCHNPLLMAKFLTIRYLILGGITHLFGIINFSYGSD